MDRPAIQIGGWLPGVMNQSPQDFFKELASSGELPHGSIWLFVMIKVPPYATLGIRGITWVAGGWGAGVFHARTRVSGHSAVTLFVRRVLRHQLYTHLK